MCLSGAMVSNTGDGKFEPFCRNDKYFLTEFSKFNKKKLWKTQIFLYIFTFPQTSESMLLISVPSTRVKSATVSRLL